jgi:hypothetical protein
MKLERLTTTGDSVAAAVIKGLLEEAGIPVMLRSYGSAGWLFPGTPGSLGAMDVLVPVDRLAEGRRLLAEAEAAADDEMALRDAAGAVEDPVTDD